MGGWIDVEVQDEEWGPETYLHACIAARELSCFSAVTQPAGRVHCADSTVM